MANRNKNAAIIYCRVSTDRQSIEKGGTSLITQFMAAQEYARSHGLDAVKSYEEVHSGGSYLGRPELQKALKDIEEGRAQHLICYNFDRYSRNDSHQHQIKDRVELAGGTIHFCTDHIDTSTSDGHLTFGIKGVLASNERMRIKERTALGRLRKAERGQQPFRSVDPFGYKIVKKHEVKSGLYSPELEGKYLLIESEGEIMAEVFHRVAAGATVREAARWMYSIGVKNRVGKALSPQTLLKMLRNALYKGQPEVFKWASKKDERRILEGLQENYMVKNDPDKIVALTAPAVVSEEEWNLVQARLDRNQEERAGRKGEHNMLGGMLRCPVCKKCMRLRTTNSYRIRANGEKKRYQTHRYTCVKSWKGDSIDGSFCSTKSYANRLLHETVLGQVREMAHRPECVKSAIEEMRASLAADVDKKDVKRLEKELKQVKHKMKVALEAQLRGVEAGVPTSIYEDILCETAVRKTELEAELEELMARLAAVDTDAITDQAHLLHRALQSVDEALTSETLTLKEKRSLLATVIDSIYPGEDADEVRIVWKEMAK